MNRLPTDTIGIIFSYLSRDEGYKVSSVSQCLRNLHALYQLSSPFDIINLVTSSTRTRQSFWFISKLADRMIVRQYPYPTQSIARYCYTNTTLGLTESPSESDAWILPQLKFYKVYESLQKSTYARKNKVT